MHSMRGATWRQSWLGTVFVRRHITGHDIAELTERGEFRQEAERPVVSVPQNFDGCKT